MSDLLKKPPSSATTRARSWQLPGRIVCVTSGGGDASAAVNSETHKIAVALCAKGYSVVVLNECAKPDPHWMNLDGVRHVNLATPVGIDAIQVLQEAVQVFKPSVVFSTSSYANALSGRTAAAKFGVPFVFRLTAAASTTTAAIERQHLAALGAAATLVDSNEMADQLAAIGIERDKLTILSAMDAGSKTETVANAIDRIVTQTKLPKLPLQQPTTNSSAPGLSASFAAGKLRVAAVMDEFTYHSYAPECDICQLTPENAVSELAAFRPELLFIESAWRGKDDLWGSKVGHKAQELIQVVDWCRQRNIPTVFWNKEDPIHFETFLSTAKLFDFVFTTDIDCIHRYKAALGHENVYLLPFACQPLSNNPIEKFERKDAFCFAGAYYVRYPDRTRDLGNFMTALAEHKPVEIYDRNFGKSDPNYQFPSEYQPFIVGNLPFDQIDKAYKGYRYAINLNSIKQSQSMFARRVFELLASNTITVSNFSRGVRLVFGDLVFTTDNGAEIVRRIRALGGDANVRKFRLAGLRKVMSDHTYEDRLAYIVSKVTREPSENLLPQVVATAFARNDQEFSAITASCAAQTYSNQRLIIVVPDDFTPTAVPAKTRVVTSANAASIMLEEIARPGELIASINPTDYYGPNYLLDLVLATRYSAATAIGKSARYEMIEEGQIQLVAPDTQYRAVSKLAARSSVVRSDFVARRQLGAWVAEAANAELHADEMQSIDEFNYCKNAGLVADAAVAMTVGDLQDLDKGIPAAEMIARAERIAPEQVEVDEVPVLTGAALAECFKPQANRGYALAVSENVLEVNSSLADGKHEYLYAATDFLPADLGFSDKVRIYFDVTPGLNLQLVLRFLDATKTPIETHVKTANRNHESLIPVGTEWIKFGLRIYGGGTASIVSLVLGERSITPGEVIGRAEHLVLTNHYPSYDELYRNGFLHTRVAAYAERGVRLDVFRLRKDAPLSYHEFQDIDVITGSQEALDRLLSDGRYKTILVHFLDEPMWEVLKHYVDKIRVIVWIHGADIQPWERRAFNYSTDDERAIASRASDKRMAFWKGLLSNLPKNLKLVFVSKQFAESVMEDLGFRLPSDTYEIVHNPINTELFSYEAKPVEQRKKILSVRPYATRMYANDVAVKTILALSQKPFFEELEFRLIGDGKLFDEVLAPVRNFANVRIERRFLSHREIADLHKDYGLFLCPTRWDSQGVSKDEAMSSGLIPIINNVAAIPEFVDTNCAILAAPESAAEMAAGISMLYENPAKFAEMSYAAAQRVRKQSSIHNIITAELNLFTPAARVAN